MYLAILEDVYKRQEEEVKALMMLLQNYLDEYSKSCLLYTSIAAARPEFVTREEVPQERVDKEMEILKVQAMNEGKPEQIAEKIVQGLSLIHI